MTYSISLFPASRWKARRPSAPRAAVQVAAVACLLLSMIGIDRAAAQIGTGSEAAPPLVYSADLDLEKAHSQSWSIAQDHRGVIYVGNGEGLLVFDGAHWTYDAVDFSDSGAREETLRALAFGPSGRLYLGLVDAFGYVDPARDGAFVSLSSALPDSLRAFGAVWSVAALPGAAYFATDTHVFRIPLPYARTPDPEQVEALSPFDVRAPDGTPLAVAEDATVFLGFPARGQFYTHISRVGLTVATPRGLQLLPDGDRLADVGVFGVVALGPLVSDGLLVLSSDGMHRHDGRAFTPFGGALSARIALAEPYIARLGSNGTIAIGTRREGVFFIDRAGTLVAHVGTKHGLGSDTIVDVLPDRDGGLWLALDDGIARIEASPAIGAFTDASGLRGGPQTITRMPDPAGGTGTLFAGTGLGLYRLVPGQEAGAFGQFEIVPNLTATVWALLAPPEGTAGPLLVGTTSGLYQLPSAASDVPERLWGAPLEAVFCLLRDPHDPTLLWAGGSTALFGLRERNGTYEVVHQHHVGDSVRSLVVDEHQRIWMGTGATGLLRLDRADAELVRYGVEQGLAEDFERTFLAVADGRPLAVVPDSVLVFDEARGRFARDSAWFGDFSVTTLVPTDSGAVWVLGGETEDQQDLLFYRQVGAPPDTLVTRLRDALIGSILPEADGTVWLTGLAALYRTPPLRSPLPPLYALVHRVSTLGADSTLYGGFGYPGLADPLPPSSRALRFMFGAPSFDDPAATKYQVRLDGLDDGWGRWTDESQRDYTNLPHGAYTFTVRARDVHGRISAPATFPFRVLPPWYQTMWAYGLWALLGAAFVASLIQWQGARRDQREHLLEQEVRTRTHEVKQQAIELQRLNEALAKQAAELRQTNEELWEAGELKTNMLGMAAHDLQTPLTSVLGFSDVLISEIPPDDERHDLARRIRDSSNEMRILIGDLLNSVAAQTGRLRLSREYVDLCEIAEQAVRRLEPQALRKEQSIDLVLDGPAMADVDADRVRDAMTNLLSNAVKYAPLGSTIKVLARLDGEQFGLSVSDEGPGLSVEEQERLFRPFERLSPQPTGGEASSGLGLFLVYEIAELHGGEVHVDSRPGAGSTFTLLLPADAPVYEPPQAPSSLSQAGPS